MPTATDARPEAKAARMEQRTRPQVKAQIQAAARRRRPSGLTERPLRLSVRSAPAAATTWRSAFIRRGARDRSLADPTSTPALCLLSDAVLSPWFRLEKTAGETTVSRLRTW